MALSQSFLRRNSDNMDLLSDQMFWTVHLAKTAFLEVFPDWEPTDSRALATSTPSETLPKTTCLPSSQLVLAVVMKNWLPLVLGPAFAIEMQKGSCFRTKFSSLNLSPKTDFPPVPSPLVKSPPWIMKLGMTRWKGLPANLPAGSFPSQSLTKFQTVLGTIPPKRSRTMSPEACPPIQTEMETLWVAVCCVRERVHP